ncbi:hypothetical protein F4W09_02140 [Acinetobacter tandoii]|uniref:Uncharacterized protein n=1 Tax=Acinetobacter tandoii TaxID=202954 RepID=A0A5N4WRD1_9GAMM|nr:Imm41 family immunity protein [Acinetobacter tandoii]KAB1859944.1 hypothetical protein F4W09_02140 [Acinetobacter tandoii]
MFENFNRNITFLGEGIYDPNSFIGLWLDYCVWSDLEYWKLEKDLLSINFHYPKNTPIPRNVLWGVMRITQLMIVSDWDNFSILKEHELYTVDEDWGIPTIYDRYERFKYVLGILFTDETDLDHINFGYSFKAN